MIIGGLRDNDENFQALSVKVGSRNPEVTIGRNDGNAIKINSPSLSRNHAKIVYVNGGYRLVDLKSTNGCYVNNRRVENEEIFPGDEIRCGKVILRLEDDVKMGISQLGVAAIVTTIVAAVVVLSLKILSRSER